MFFCQVVGSLGANYEKSNFVFEWRIRKQNLFLRSQGTFRKWFSCWFSFGETQHSMRVEALLVVVAVLVIPSRSQAIEKMFERIKTFDSSWIPAKTLPAIQWVANIINKPRPQSIAHFTLFWTRCSSGCKPTWLQVVDWFLEMNGLQKAGAVKN